MSEHTHEDVGTQAESSSQHASAEPQIPTLSDEALENVAGGCQMGDSRTGPYDPFRPVPILPDVTF